MGSMEKSFDELTITDDFMFYKVLQNKRICKRLLNSVLKDQIGEIVEVEYQKTIGESALAKGTRMDVWVKDAQGRIFDVEMQATNFKDLPQRMRYYQSQTDIYSLSKGTDYEDLPDTFIIFFCPFDFPKASLPVYTFQSICVEQTNIRLQDGATKIMINCSVADKAENEDLRAFMKYVNSEITDHPFAQEIDEEVTSVKENDRYRGEWFSWKARLHDEYRLGKMDGIEEGIDEAKEKIATYFMQQDATLDREAAMRKAQDVLYS